MTIKTKELYIDVVKQYHNPPEYDVVKHNVVVWKGHRLLGQLFNEVYDTKYQAQKRAKELKELLP